MSPLAPPSSRGFTTGAQTILSTTTTLPNANLNIPWDSTKQGDDLIDTTTPALPFVKAAGVYWISANFFANATAGAFGTLSLTANGHRRDGGAITYTVLYAFPLSSAFSSPGFTQNTVQGTCRMLAADTFSVTWSGTAAVTGAQVTLQVTQLS